MRGEVVLKIGFIGAGKMAEALIRAMADIEHTEVTITASDVMEDRRRLIGGIDCVTATEDNKEVVDNSDIIFIAVKPQMIDVVLEEMRETEKLVISIAAGISLAHMESSLPKARVIRIMPNTPCLVGEMAGGFALGSKATEKDAQLLVELVSNAGIIFKLDESLMDAVTGLSGSGPAFVAYIIRAMADGGIKQGLPEGIALKLAAQTVMGTGKLLRDMDLDPDTLITMVSSPGGTTVAGRNVLENSDVKEVMENTIKAATERGKELGRGEK